MTTEAAPGQVLAGAWPGVDFPLADSRFPPPSRDNHICCRALKANVVVLLCKVPGAQHILDIG